MTKYIVGVEVEAKTEKGALDKAYTVMYSEDFEWKILVISKEQTYIDTHKTRSQEEDQ